MGSLLFEASRLRKARSSHAVHGAADSLCSQPSRLASSLPAFMEGRSVTTGSVQVAGRRACEVALVAAAVC